MIIESTVDECNNPSGKHSLLNPICYYLSFFILIVITYLSNSLNSLTIVNIIIFLIGLLLLKKRNDGLFNVVTIFYVLCYLFHCSYFILIATNNVCGNAHVFISLSEKIQIDTLRYCNYFFSIFPFGCLFAKDNTKNINSRRIFLNIEQSGKIGITLMIVSIIPRLYVDMTMFRAYLSSGYTGVFKVYINNYIILLANLFYLGTILAIYGNRKDKKKATAILIVCMLIIFISMMSGRRGTKVAYFVIIVYMYLKCVERKKQSGINIIKYILGGWTILAILATFGDSRETGTFSISTFGALFAKNFTYKLVIDQLGEFGYAAYTLGATIEYIPTQKYGYGLNYLLSWLEIFPNVGGFLTGFSDKMSFVLKLPSQYQQALGGSVLGELFYNFGYFSLIIAFPFGGIINKISISIDKIIKKEGLTFGGLISLLAAIPMMLWVRSVFNEFPRSIVWFFLIVYATKAAIYKRSN